MICPHNVYKIIEQLKQKGHEVYIVGGAVRDLLLNHKPYDFDIVTSAFTKEIIQLFKDTHKVDLVGESFKVVIVDGMEVASFRKDTYKNGKCVAIHAQTIEEDLARRDFTVNAMAFDIYTDKIIDPFNGRKDLTKRRIKFVGNPDDRIKEDPNRMLRAARFVAIIKGFYDSETLNAVKRNSNLMKQVDPERIRLEVLKAMKAKDASLFFDFLLFSGCLEYVFPYMISSFQHDHGPYHNEDVFDHLMFCGDFIKPGCPLTKLAGYLHDIGKPSSTDYDDNGILHFNGHENIGEELIREMLSNLKFSNREINFVADLTKLHMMGVMPDSSGKSVRKLLRRLKDRKIPVEAFMRLKIADRKANLNKEPLTLTQIKEVMRRFDEELCREEVAFGVKTLKVNGYDVMETLKIEPGPEVGKVLDRLFERVEEDPTLNNHETLIEIMKEDYNG